MEEKRVTYVTGIKRAALSGAASAVVSLAIKMVIPQFNPVFFIVGAVLLSAFSTYRTIKKQKEDAKKGYI